mgnify:CR=1 FL=1
MSSLVDTLARWRDNVLDYLPLGAFRNTLVALLALYLLGTLVVGMYWSVSPGRFEVRTESQELLAEIGGKRVTGTETTAALIGVMELLLEKRGGFIHIDRE